MPKKKDQPEGNEGLPDDPTPRADFFGYAMPEGADNHRGMGFGFRGYWKFGANMRPRIFARIRIGGTIWRFNLRPASKDSFPGKGIVERALQTEAAMRAADYGRTPEIPEEEEP